jgi:hypothetical protein
MNKIRATRVMIIVRVSDTKLGNLV